MKFHTKLWSVLNISVLGSIKLMDLLEFIVELNIYYYLEIKNMISSTIGLDILQERKLVLYTLFIIT